MKTILLVILLSVGAFAQDFQLSYPFVATNDTLSGITADTVQMRQKVSGLNYTAWVQAATIAVADVTGEVTNAIDLSAVSGYTWAEIIQLRVFNQTDTLSSGDLYIGSTYNELMLFFQADTVESGATDTTLVKARLYCFKQ